MTAVLRKGNQQITMEICEHMLWYEMIITAADGKPRLERYTERAALLRRQHELLAAWKAQGWQELDAEPVVVVRR